VRVSSVPFVVVPFVFLFAAMALGEYLPGTATAS
jgi:hypothetical protein